MNYNAKFLKAVAKQVVIPSRLFLSTQGFVKGGSLMSPSGIFVYVHRLDGFKNLLE